MCCLCKYCEILGSGRGARITIGGAVGKWSDFVLEQTAIIDKTNNRYSIPKVFDKGACCESERRAGALDVGFTPVNSVDWVCAWLSDDRLVSQTPEVSVHGDS